MSIGQPAHDLDADQVALVRHVVAGTTRSTLRAQLGLDNVDAAIAGLHAATGTRNTVHLAAWAAACGIVTARPGTALAGRPHLTPRYRQVLDALVAGADEREISQELGVAPATLRTYVKTIAQQLGAAGRTQLAAAAVLNGVVRLSAVMPGWPDEPLTATRDRASAA
ncbi:helix-turn-helix transcriptional regulator [Kitasatospora sp. NA04385]|uniref:helix-turn-helix transcriptional regulator n=1 Tax=Kitasatospora sp. NA04385 TaxID=2742135 RepID=UPI0015900950|nr:helix-turn-helix transcriptional regulator [Kitasatospora sp. NA04385]QKW20565.1 helix-turn-helix transcriptional regulator [Kitasatospora sp. NA04385]